MTRERLERLTLAAILLLAAALRFTGILHHVVRGAPDFDEQHNFVRPILRMAREGTLDPTVYQGYAGLFNWLAAGPVLLGERLGGEAWAFGAARGVAAAFGLLNVLLVYVLARRLAGPAAGLFAAALLGVSRLDVRAAHYVTPDLLVASAVLVVLIVAAQALAPRAELLLGALVGLAAAVKYTGLYAAIPAGIALLLEPDRWRRLLRFAPAVALSFALAAPYAVLALAQRGGRLSGLVHYYGERAESNREARSGENGAQGAALWLRQGVGPLGLALAVAAPLLFGERRRLVPALVTLAAGWLALAQAAYVYPRHVVPPAAVLAALSGVGFACAIARAGRAGPFVGAAIALLALPLQAREALSLTVKYTQPAAVDRAAEWIERERRGPDLIAASLPRLAVDPSRFEVRRLRRLDAQPLALLAQFDLVVSGDSSEPALLEGFRVLASFRNEDRLPGRTLTILAPPAAARDLEPVAAELRRDGAALVLHLAQPRRIARLEIELAAEGRWPRETQVQGRREGAAWGSITAEPLRPTGIERQRAAARPGQVFAVVRAEPLTELRIARADGEAWGELVARAFAWKPGVEPPPDATRERQPRKRR